MEGDNDENIRIVNRTGYTEDPSTSRAKGRHYSRFHILVNPVRVLDKVKDKVKYDNHVARLEALARFLLKDPTIKSYLKFFPPRDGNGDDIEVDRQWHLDRILKITEKEGAVEDSSPIYKRAHIHLVFDIEHETYLQVDRPKVEEISRIFFADVMGPNGGVYVHIRATNAANFFLEYIRKNQIQSSFNDPMTYTGDGADHLERVREAVLNPEQKKRVREKERVKRSKRE